LFCFGEGAKGRVGIVFQGVLLFCCFACMHAIACASPFPPCNSLPSLCPLKLPPPSP
jgi:hypothetical protein